MQDGEKRGEGSKRRGGSYVGIAPQRKSLQQFLVGAFKVKVWVVVVRSHCCYIPTLRLRNHGVGWSSGTHLVRGVQTPSTPSGRAKRVRQSFAHEPGLASVVQNSLAKTAGRPRPRVRRCAVCKAAERAYQRKRYRCRRGLTVDPLAPLKLSMIDSPPVSSTDGSVVEVVRDELAVERPGLTGGR